MEDPEREVSYESDDEFGGGFMNVDPPPLAPARVVAVTRAGVGVYEHARATAAPAVPQHDENDPQASLQECTLCVYATEDSEHWQTLFDILYSDVHDVSLTVRVQQALHYWRSSDAADAFESAGVAQPPLDAAAINAHVLEHIVRPDEQRVEAINAVRRLARHAESMVYRMESDDKNLLQMMHQARMGWSTLHRMVSGGSVGSPLGIGRGGNSGAPDAPP